KPFTVAAALEEATAYEGQEFYCGGYLEYGGDKIYCHTREGDGIVTLEESIKYSCNVALMDMAAAMGKNIFCKYQDIFNFGKKTGIDLPGEESGLLYTMDNMGPTDLATNSFGQNYNVTMMQMAAAFSSLINGGYYYEPHVMKKILDPSGATIGTAETEVVKETVSESTSEALREMLYQTVEGGTGNKSRIEGYTIGGKTGTAEKHPRGEDRYLVSFISFAPVDDPQIVVYIVIDEPNIPKQSDAAQATMMSKKIYEEVLPYLGIFPSVQPQEPETKENGEPQTGEPESTGNTGNTGEPQGTEPEAGNEEETTAEGETTGSEEETTAKRITPIFNEEWEEGLSFMEPVTSEGETETEGESETTSGGQ
ncbi:MAG: penicillin-binding protein 2, partial [Lachnospiraceae bacterium]|nr:penicillin-binding protein 2 [Lachnospiraceae bacterium]